MATVIGQDPRFITNCTKCGANIKFEKNDVRAGKALPGSYDDHKSIISCPQCHTGVDVTTSYGPASAEQYQQQERDDY